VRHTKQASYQYSTNRTVVNQKRNSNGKHYLRLVTTSFCIKHRFGDQSYNAIHRRQTFRNKQRLVVPTRYSK